MSQTRGESFRQFALRLSTEGKPDTYRGDIPLRNPMVSPCGERANG